MFLFCLGLLGCAARSTAHPASPVQLTVDGVAAPFHGAQVVSVDDANERYRIVLVIDAGPDAAASHTFVLAAGDTRLTTSSWGRSGDETWGVFDAAPAQARRFAAGLDVDVHDRAPWPGRLEGRLEARGSVAAGAAAVPVTFTLRNTGPEAVWFLDGGRQRNELGRDNRFTFTITRGGETLELRQVGDFGGLGAYRRLEPGASWPLAVDLAHWCTFDRAGSYTIDASYEADLMPADYEPAKTLAPGSYSHLQRTRTVCAHLDLVVD